MIAVDPGRNSVWTIEFVAQRLRRFDFAGKETLTINGVNGYAIAVDETTGNVWVLTGEGRIGDGKTVVYDERGNQVASHDISGWDIVYDAKAKAFWIAEKNLTKITAASSEVLFSAAVSTWCASSLDVDQRSGTAWVAVREYTRGDGSGNRLLKFDARGKDLLTIELDQETPFRVSVDSRNGSVWVAHLGKSIERFSSEGKSEAEYPITALAIEVDAAGGDVWVVTPTDVQKVTSSGEVASRLDLVGRTSQAWIASYP
jgi:DNA-binding beta-propeller fold protein YncE